MFLAQIIVASPECIPGEFRWRIRNFMESFLKVASHQALMEGEIKQWYVWSTFFPYIRPLYIPDPPSRLHNASLGAATTIPDKSTPETNEAENEKEEKAEEEEEEEISKRLRMLSLQTILLSLQNMLGRDNHRKVLFQEGLEDYITCVPAYVPPQLRGQAEDLVRILGSGVQLQPPKLVNMVKAKLAKMHFGLEGVAHATVGEIITAALPT